jgi:hypothetical protein
MLAFSNAYDPEQESINDNLVGFVVDATLCVKLLMRPIRGASDQVGDSTISSRSSVDLIVVVEDLESGEEFELHLSVSIPVDTRV